jgi:hypothetical protein
MMFILRRKHSSYRAALLYLLRNSVDTARFWAVPRFASFSAQGEGVKEGSYFVDLLVLIHLNARTREPLGERERVALEFAVGDCGSRTDETWRITCRGIFVLSDIPHAKTFQIL